jgi:hypothetical protein
MLVGAVFVVVAVAPMIAPGFSEPQSAAAQSSSPDNAGTGEETTC